MALRRPTIATAYSGNLEFMNDGNSLLVDYKLVPVARGEYLVDDERFVWAEPDIASAARCMRRLLVQYQDRSMTHAASRTNTIMTIPLLGALVNTLPPINPRKNKPAEKTANVPHFFSFSRTLKLNCLLPLRPSAVLTFTASRYWPRIGKRYFQLARPRRKSSCISWRRVPSTQGKSVEKKPPDRGALSRIVTDPSVSGRPFASVTSSDMVAGSA